MTAPENSILIAASYAAEGRLIDVQSCEITTETTGETFNFAFLAPGSSYQIMLADKTTFAPLCEA